MDASDFKTSDNVSGSLFKGAAFHKNDKPENKSIPRPKDTAIDFESMSDDDKKCWSYVADKYIPNIYEPSKWAREESSKSGLPAKGLAKAAKQYQKDFEESEDVFKYPWWSAARDWNPELIGDVGKKMSRFDPDMARQVQGSFRW